MKTYIEALNAGKEIVILGNDENTEFNSSIFFKKNGSVFVYNREIGTCKHALNENDLEKHFCSCAANGFLVFVRG